MSASSDLEESLSRLNLGSTDGSGPRLPIPGARNVLVTSALPYVNNVPHLGNLIGAVLSADVYARYLRQRGVNVIYICGTDEYGTTTETKAQEEGLSPQEICDKYHALHAEIYRWFDVQFDHFGRTSAPAQTEIVQEVFWEVFRNGFIKEDTIKQLYCETDQRFLADRYVNGTCPKCSYEDARGDQCDNCGSLLNPAELLRPVCVTCGKTPVTRGTKHLFIDLPKIEKELGEWAKETHSKNTWSANSIALTETWLRDGLKARCITRDLQWGVPVPLEGYKDKVFYVWFDAPLGYVSITADYTSEWKQWWGGSTPLAVQSGANDTTVELVQFMGKDNTPFHTILFPSTLLATRKRWTMLKNLSTTEYLNYESGKFSKSRGVGVFGGDAISSGIESEVWRYYLLVNRPESSDTVFTWSDFAAKNNDELLKNLGNFLHRTVSFITSTFDSTIPAFRDPLDETTQDYLAQINVLLKQYNESFGLLSFKRALKTAMAISSLGNAYLQTQKPWKAEVADAGSALAFSANLAALVVALVEPFLGSKFSLKALKQLGLDPACSESHRIPDVYEAGLYLKPGHKIGADPAPLFKNITADLVNKLRKTFGGIQNAKTADVLDFPFDLRVGLVKQVNHHPENESLCVLRVDLGEERPRTAVAGSIRGTTLEKDLMGQRIAVLCNIQKTSLGGVESEGMMLVGSSTSGKKQRKVTTIGVLSFAEDAVVGKPVVPKGISSLTGRTRAHEARYEVLDRKKFQQLSKALRVGAGGMVLWKKAEGIGTIADDGQWIPALVKDVAEGGRIK